MISRVRQNFSCSFVVLFRTFRSHTILYLFAAFTEQQPENTFSWKCRKCCKAIPFSRISVDVLQQLMEENMAGMRKALVGQIRNKLKDRKL